MRSPGEPREGNGRRMRAGLSLLVAGALVLYPLLMYISESRLGVQWMAIGVIAVCVLRLAVSRFAAPSARGERRSRHSRAAPDLLRRHRARAREHLGAAPRTRCSTIRCS